MHIKEAFAPAIVWILANPSTADALKDDPTTRNVKRISENMGYNTSIVLNVCAYRTPYPLELIKARAAGVDVIGADNISRIAAVLSTRGVQKVVYGWGDCLPEEPYFEDAIDRVRQVVGECGHNFPVCFGKNVSGRPRHPLYLSGATPPDYYQHHR
jgi:hypothetical protein